MCWWFWMNIITMWKDLMHWIKNYSNYGWLIRKPCQTGAFTSQGICKYLQLPSLTVFPPYHVAELKRDCFYGGLPKWLKVMVAYLKAGPQVRTYSDYLRATREAEKEDSIELPQSSRVQTSNGPPNQGLLASSPRGNLRVISHFPKSPVYTWHI